jgi:hypothetical protein
MADLLPKKISWLAACGLNPSGIWSRGNGRKKKGRNTRGRAKKRRIPFHCRVGGGNEQIRKH